MNIKIDFYDNFRCRADRCKNTCCAGWEIDIDEISLKRFQQYEGAFGDKMKRSITCEDGEYHFINDENERCPFLLENGLCELIIEKGEESLSDICSLHPRFFFETEGHWFSGLGMACEEAADKVLNREGELRFLVDETLCSFSDMLKMAFPDLEEDTFLTDRFLEEERMKDTLRLLSETEPINDKWAKEIESLLSSDLEGAVTKMKDFCLDESKKRMLERCYIYILYRELEHFETYGFEILKEYAGRNAAAVLMMSLSDGDFCDAARRWSEQMEYAVENVEFFHEELLWGSDFS